MRKSIALKTLLRSPLKTLLTFLLIAAASFALFSRVTDYAVTMRETENAKSLYHAVASLDNEVPDIPMIVADVPSPDGSEGASYGAMYEMEDKPWLTEEEMKEFASLPGVTLADKRYMTAGRVEGYKRLVGEGEFGGPVLFEASYAGYEEDASTPEDHIYLKFEDVEVIACGGEPKMETSFTTGIVPLGEAPYAESPYTRAFYDSLEIGSRCLVLADNTGERYGGSSGIYFRPHIVGEGALRVIDGEPDNYLETEAFARQKGWADAINHNLYVYDIEYTSDMRAIGFGEKSMAKGRLLTEKDTDVCVVSEDFLKEYGLSIGDSISVQLGDQLCHDWAKAETGRGGEGRLVPDAEKISEFVGSAELTIVGAYPCEQYDSPNTIYVPSSLLPVEVPAGYEPRCYEFSVFVEDARDIEAFQKAAEQFAEKVDLKLEFSDGGWLDVKDSFALGAFTSLLTTVLYAVGSALALFLAVYLYIGRNKKSYAIMRMLGVPGRVAGNSVVLPFVAVSVLAAPIGGIVGLYYAQKTAEKVLQQMAASAPPEYVPNTELPISVVILCLISELLIVTLAAYLFLRKMKKTPPLELLQEGAKRRTEGLSSPAPFDAQVNAFVPAKLDMAKLSVTEELAPRGNYGAFRHVAAYIRRHMRRGLGKTAVSLILATVLAAGIGSFVLARITYQDAFYEYGVKGNAHDFIFTSVVELSQSPLVKDFYCQESFSARVQGTEVVIPMTVTSDFTRDLGNHCTVDYAEGYDVSAFEGTGQVCLVGRELAETLNISLGNEIGIMSDILHSMLNMGKTGENAVAEGYKTYKVIGIARSDDTSVKGSIFVGIRSDLQRLFFYGFSSRAL